MKLHMEYKINEYYKMPIKNLKIWTDNPRLGSVAMDEKDAINLLFEEVGESAMLNLVKNILEKGLANNDIPSIVQNDAKDFFVYDGNRRITVSVQQNSVYKNSSRRCILRI